MIEPALGALLGYGLSRGLLVEDDVVYVRNRILEVLRIRDYDLAAETLTFTGDLSVDELLLPLLDHAAARGLIDPDTAIQRDLWDTAIMGCFLDSPSRINADFWRAHATASSAATDYLHGLSVASNYIRVARTDRNPSWRQPSRYGEFEITINISKPEKDPRDIAASASAPVSGYPACLLCAENEGFAGDSGYPARQNLRLARMQLAGEPWLLQYSPYRYFNEHCIVLSREHRPMLINDATFDRLHEFAELFPHYLIGSNADLPIVGGSILSHDHFQGGAHEFPMERAEVLSSWQLDDLEIGVLNWPLSVIRLTGPAASVKAVARQVLAAWRTHDDVHRGILARTGSTLHNTITPILRSHDDRLCLYIVLRNNRTSVDHPDGVFHPHAEIHPVKRENIGLIEVLGLAVLPARLQSELAAVASALADRSELPRALVAHQPMLDGIRSSVPRDLTLAQAEKAVRLAAGGMFVTGLEHCGVFGNDQVAGIAEFLAASDVIAP